MAKKRKPKKLRMKILRRAWIPKWPPECQKIFEDKHDAEGWTNKAVIPVSVVITEI